MHLQLIIAFSLYFAVILLIGIFAHRQQNTAQDFIMGGRSLSYWVTAFSAHASDMSAWLFMAFPAAVYLGGMPALWIALGLILGMFLNWQFIARKLRVETEKRGCSTLSTFLESRFDDKSGLIRIITATIVIFFMGCYLAANLIGIGTVVESVFGIDYTIAISVAMFVAMIYSFVGGYYTVAKVDQFQALFLLFAIFLVPLVTYLYLPGGFHHVSKVAQDNAIPMTLIADSSWESIRSIVFLALGWGLGYFGQPHIVTKFMGIKSPAELVKSKWVGMTWQVLALGFAAIVGFIGIGYFNASLYDPQLVFVEMVKELFNPLIGGFILCGLIAATLSTMDSQIIVSASVISEDFWKYFVKKHASDKELIWVSRLSVVALSFFSIFLAYSKNSTVEKAVLYAWSGLGCSFGPAIIMALYDPKSNRYGAIAGIAIGGLIAGFWPSILPYISSFDIPSMIPGFFASILTIYLVSRVSAPKAAA